MRHRVRLIKMRGAAGVVRKLAIEQSGRQIPGFGRSRGLAMRISFADIRHQSSFVTLHAVQHRVPDSLHDRPVFDRSCLVLQHPRQLGDVRLLGPRDVLHCVPKRIGEFAAGENVLQLRYRRRAGLGGCPGRNPAATPRSEAIMSGFARPNLPLPLIET